MHRILPIALAFLLIALVRPSLASDWQQLLLDVPQGIKTVESSGGQIFVQDLTGVWMRAVLDRNMLALSPSSEPPRKLSTDPDKLPDTEIAFGRTNIKRAWFAQPTRRYGHGVLGDGIEAGALKITANSGETTEIVLPETAVFEDRVPRLADINKDGNDEVIVVKSYLDQGAAVALVGQVNGSFEIIAESPAIGQSNRWLNPVGAADFDGDGIIEIAVVITPHIGGTLQLYEWQVDKLVADHSLYGFSNHAMGSRELGLAAIIDLNQDGIKDILLPDASRRALIGVSFATGQATILQRRDLSGPLGSGLHVIDLDQDGDVEILYATTNDELVVLKSIP